MQQRHATVVIQRTKCNPWPFVWLYYQALTEMETVTGFPHSFILESKTIIIFRRIYYAEHRHLIVSDLDISGGICHASLLLRIKSGHMTFVQLEENCYYSSKQSERSIKPRALDNKIKKGIKWHKYSTEEVGKWIWS